MTQEHKQDQQLLTRPKEKSIKAGSLQSLEDSINDSSPPTGALKDALDAVAAYKGFLNG